MVMDALMAFKQLLSDQRVDPEKIAIAGHSRGGIISFAAPDRRYTDKILGKDRHFAASIPMAAACDAMLFENPKPSKYTKYYIFHGLADNYTPAKFCIEYGKKLEAAGASVEYDLREDWHQGFFSAEMERECSSCVRFTRCPAKAMYGDKGYFTKNYVDYVKTALKMDLVKLWEEVEKDLGTKTPMKTFVKVYRKLYFKCGDMGVTVGGWHGDTAASAINKFLLNTLK